MNIKEVLSTTVDYFKKYNIPQAQLDAEVLLAYVLNMERIHLYVKIDLPLEEDELSVYRQLVLKRVRRYPVAYLIGNKEFMSLDFKVNEDVLIPRPETELLVEAVINFCQENNLSEPNIVDIGTGSGAIAVSLGHYLQGSKVLGIDISKKALNLAHFNIEKHNLSSRVKVIEGDLLERLIKRGKNNVDIVVSNPPYISLREMEELPPEVKYEPQQALEAGEEGLDYYNRIIPQAKQILRNGGLLALEAGYKQVQTIAKNLESEWQKIKVIKDYAGHDRIVTAIKV